MSTQKEYSQDQAIQFGVEIIRERRKKGLRIEDLAKLLEIHPATLVHYELGNKRPSIRRARQIAEVFQTPWEIFLSAGFTSQEIEAESLKRKTMKK